MLGASYDFENPSVKINYKNFLYKYDPIKDKRIYILQISSYDLLKISNVKIFFDAQEEAIKMLLKDEPAIDKNNSIIFTFFDLKRGIKFLPDIRVFTQGINFKTEVEVNKNIALGGMVVIVPSKGLVKYKKAIVQLSRFFDPATNVDIVGTEEDAFRALESFK